MRKAHKNLHPFSRKRFTFGVPFDEIAPIVERSETAARQLASRARRRVRGGARDQDADLAYRREVVEAFLSASRAGNFDALLAVLDPDVVFRRDLTAVPAARQGRSTVRLPWQGSSRGVLRGHDRLW